MQSGRRTGNQPADQHHPSRYGEPIDGSKGIRADGSLKKPDPAVGILLPRSIVPCPRSKDRSSPCERTRPRCENTLVVPERAPGAFCPLASGPSVTCTCGTTEIFADPMINKVFSNLFDNAVRHGETVTDIQVWCEKAADTLIITVEDNGEGIPLDEKQKIFEKGFGRNTGIGLFLVREILAITGVYP